MIARLERGACSGQEHFEQNFHVRHRLDAYGAGRAMDYACAQPDFLGEAIARQLAMPAACRPVEDDGAARAARLVAEQI